MDEFRFNHRAGRHTFVVRSYKSRRTGKTRYYMRVAKRLYVWGKDGKWYKVTVSNDGLRVWAKAVFDINFNSRGSQIA